MKKIIGNILSLLVVLTVVSCKDNSFDLNYKAPLTIAFTGVDNSNIVTVAKGVLTYTATINVKASPALIKHVEIYNADSKTGVKGTLISGTAQDVNDGSGNGLPSYSATYVVDNLIDNKAIKVIATDDKGNTYGRNLFVKITPAVLFSQTIKIETIENYYGPYYGNWFDGRVYMRSTGATNKKEIDFSLGDVIIPIEGATAVPALVSPAARTTYSLLTMTDLQDTKFEATTLTKAQFDAISKTDATPITSLAAPTKDAVKLVIGKVYLFKTANGKTGLIYISALDPKTGTIENTAGEWIKLTPYFLATLTTKVVAI